MVFKLKENAVDLYKAWIGSRVIATVLISQPPRRLADVVHRPSRSAYRQDQSHGLVGLHPLIIGWKASIRNSST